MFIRGTQTWRCMVYPVDEEEHAYLVRAYATYSECTYLLSSKMWNVYAYNTTASHISFALLREIKNKEDVLHFISFLFFLCYHRYIYKMSSWEWSFINSLCIILKFEDALLKLIAWKFSSFPQIFKCFSRYFSSLSTVVEERKINFPSFQITNRQISPNAL